MIELLRQELSICFVLFYHGQASKIKKNYICINNKKLHGMI